MKKILSLLISFCIIFFAGCQNETAKNPETTVTDTEHNSAPYIVSVTVDELRTIKNAIYTMEENNFKSYMFKNHYGALVNGMYSIENANLLMEELESSMIPMLDSDETCFKKLLFYHERNEIQCVIPYTESIAISFNIYTPKSDRKENGVFGMNNSEAVLKKELIFDNILVYVYKTDTKDEFFADVFADNTYILVRTTGITDIEEFEECFSRLEFRKIGDLMDEIPEETTEKDSSENEQTSVTENVSVAETTLPEQTENLETETQLTEFTDIPEETTLTEPTEEVTAE
ncbi:MAG: hypothetical protein IJB16_01645 [Clostridia bacterium]|nr:hypothetical protein [Clostridia bacterium]